MSITDPTHNPSNSNDVKVIKETASDMAYHIEARCPDNHVRQLALDHLRIATMLAVQSLFED